MATDNAPASMLAGTFNFRITLRRSAGAQSGAAAPTPTTTAPTPSSMQSQLGDGGFQECTGLDLEMDVQELVEGGRNDGIVRRVGRGKYASIVLKRGMFFAPGGRVRDELWSWLNSILAGERPVRRYDGRIDLFDSAGSKKGTIVASWTFDRGLPQKISGPALNAKTGEIAIEELTIAHEGLRLVPRGA